MAALCVVLEPRRASPSGALAAVVCIQLLEARAKFNPNFTFLLPSSRFYGHYRDAITSAGAVYRAQHDKQRASRASRAAVAHAELCAREAAKRAEAQRQQRDAAATAAAGGDGATSGDAEVVAPKVMRRRRRRLLAARRRAARRAWRSATDVPAKGLSEGRQGQAVLSGGKGGATSSAGGRVVGFQPDSDLEEDVDMHTSFTHAVAPKSVAAAASSFAAQRRAQRLRRAKMLQGHFKLAAATAAAEAKARAGAASGSSQAPEADSGLSVAASESRKRPRDHDASE